MEVEAPTFKLKSTKKPYKFLKQAYHGKCWFGYYFFQLVLTQCLVLYAYLDLNNFSRYTEFVIIEVVTIHFVFVDIIMKIILFKKRVFTFWFVQDQFFFASFVVMLFFIINLKNQNVRISEKIDLLVLFVRYILQFARFMFIAMHIKNENVKRQSHEIKLNLDVSLDENLGSNSRTSTRLPSQIELPTGNF